MRLPFSAVCCALSLIACGRELPPRVLPAAEGVPRIAIAPGPVPEGMGRLAVDSVDVPARVYVQTAGQHHTFPIVVTVYEYEGDKLVRTHIENETGAYGATTVRPLCQTPCVADLPLGAHTLHLEPRDRPDPLEIARDTAQVTVGSSPSIYRHALGQHASPQSVFTRGIVNVGFIGAAGAITIAGGAYLGTTLSDDKSTSTEIRNGAVMLGIGAVFLTAAIIYAIVAQPVEQEGAGRQWTPPSGTVFAH